MRILYLLLLVSFSFAEILRYTGYSEVSQAAAEQEAVAGVARQISSRVESSITISRSEVSQGNSSVLGKSAKAQSSVYSNVLLKWVRINPEEKKGNLFAATASVDLDEMASFARLKMERIQSDVREKETLAQKTIAERKYAAAVEALSRISVLMEPYPDLQKEYAVYKPLDNGLFFSSAEENISAELVQALKSVRISLSEKNRKLASGVPLEMEIFVQDKNGALPDFPIYVEHRGKRIAEAFSDSTGKILFRLSEKSLFESPYTLRFLAGIPLKYRQKAGISVQNGDYEWERPSCHLKWLCSLDGSICSTILDKLEKSWGRFMPSENSGILSVKMDSRFRKKTQRLSSYLVSVTLEKENFHCHLEKIGAGRDESSAVHNAILKMDFFSCENFSKICTE